MQDKAENFWLNIGFNIVAPSLLLIKGKALLAQAIALARRNGAVRMFLEVRESNARARKMYTSFGFEETGRRKNYYPTGNGREDAILMTAQFSESVSHD